MSVVVISEGVDYQAVRLSVCQAVSVMSVVVISEGVDYQAVSMSGCQCYVCGCDFRGCGLPGCQYAANIQQLSPASGGERAVDG